jgi:hypothetical protein
MLVAGLVINTSNHVQEKQKMMRRIHTTMKDLNILKLQDQKLVLKSTSKHQDQLVELKENVAYGPIVK